MRPLNARAVQRTQQRTDLAASRSHGKRSWLAAAHQGGARHIVLLEVSRVLRLQVVPDCGARAQPPGQPRCARTADAPASRRVDEQRSCPTGGNSCTCRSWAGHRQPTHPVGMDMTAAATTHYCSCAAPEAASKGDFQQRSAREAEPVAVTNARTPCRCSAQMVWPRLSSFSRQYSTAT